MTPPKGLVLARGSDGDQYLPSLSMRARELVPIANKPILFYALETMRDAGIEDVAIVVSPSTGRAIREAVADGSAWRLRVRYVEQPKSLGVTDALLLAGPFLNGSPFVVHRGDSLLTDSIRPLVNVLSGCSVDAIVLLQKAGGSDPGGVVELSESRLLRLVNGAGQGGANQGLAGVYLFRPSVLDAAREVAGSGNGRPKLSAALERVIETGGRVETRCVEGYWRYRGLPDDLLEVNRCMLERLVADFSAADLSDSRIEGSVVIDESAVLKSTTVRGPAIIGPRARLNDAYIGPYTSIGPDVVVEGAEIEHSIVLPGATIKHLGGRLEASVVGTNAKVFRDFRLPKALRLRVGEGAEVSLA